MALLFVLVVCVFQGGAYGDDDEASTPPRQPTLDELLGLEQEAHRSDSDAEDVARQESEDALQRRLEQGRQLVDHFAQAIEQMGLSASLLEERFDAGVGTQRIQEDIIARLTHLIDEAGKQQQPSSSSSSGQPRPDPQRNPGEQERQQQQGQSEQRAGEPTEGMPPPMQQDDVHTSIAETRAEWGALPDRLRDMLLQGRQEKFSSLYEQLTREYYQRLASDD